MSYRCTVDWIPEFCDNLNISQNCFKVYDILTLFAIKYSESIANIRFGFVKSPSTKTFRIFTNSNYNFESKSLVSNVPNSMILPKVHWIELIWFREIQWPTNTHTSNCNFKSIKLQKDLVILTGQQQLLRTIFQHLCNCMTFGAAASELIYSAFEKKFPY